MVTQAGVDTESREQGQSERKQAFGFWQPMTTTP
jgi:hypothetical protein